MLEIRFVHDGNEFLITTNHAYSSYNQPVLFINGQFVDTKIEIETYYKPPNPLDVIADCWIFIDRPVGKDYDAICQAFLSEQASE